MCSENKKRARRLAVEILFYVYAHQKENAVIFKSYWNRPTFSAFCKKANEYEHDR